MALPRASVAWFLRRPAHRDRRRSIWSALANSFQSRNPILGYIDAVFDGSKGADASAARADHRGLAPLQLLGDWKDVQPRHALDTANALQKRLDREMEEVLKSQSDDKGSVSLSDLLERLDRTFAPSKALQYAITLLYVAKDKEFSSLLELVPSHDVEKVVVDALQEMASSLENDDDGDLRRAATYLVKSHEDVNLSDPEKQRTLEKYISALEQVTTDIKSSSPGAVKAAVGNMYQYLGLKTEIARLHGYQSVAEQVFARSGRMATFEQVSDLHSNVRDHIVTKLHGSKEALHQDLEQLLGRSGTPMGASSFASPGGRVMNSDQNRQDQRVMIRLQEHVTLDGILEFSIRLCRDLFGVDIVRDESTGKTSGQQPWGDSIQLFHVYTSNGQDHVGSFYVDPFDRPGKFRRPVTLPLLPRGPARCPVLYLSLSMRPPTWDTDPAAVSWEDAEAFLHELGHVMDLLLSSNPFGSIAGPVETLPVDRSELTPKFMELWMLEKSTVYALLDASQNRVAFSDESIDAALRVRARRKHLELAQLAFYGSLELHIFSDFDIRGGETLPALQMRWAHEYSPHDPPPDQSVGPLLTLFQDNAAGRPVAYYRYLWCEAQAAALFEELKDQHGLVPANDLQRQVRRHVLSQGEGEWRGAAALLSRYEV